MKLRDELQPGQPPGGRACELPDLDADLPAGTEARLQLNEGPRGQRGPGRTRGPAPGAPWIPAPVGKTLRL